MASVRKEIEIEAHPDDVWAARRDFGAVHERLAPGFVVDAPLDGDTRVVTFFNGAVASELLVDRDDESRRLVYSVLDRPFGLTITTPHRRSSPPETPKDGSSGSRICCPAVLRLVCASSWNTALASSSSPWRPRGIGRAQRCDADRMAAFVDPTPLIEERIATAVAPLREALNRTADPTKRTRLEREIRRRSREVRLATAVAHVYW
jgi:hypothetical protein